jgi:hypothetical protein
VTIQRSHREPLFSKGMVLAEAMTKPLEVDGDPASFLEEIVVSSCCCTGLFRV